MIMDYKEMINNVQKTGGILDAMLALQEKEGYLTEKAIEALASEYHMYPSQVYETASFYSMIRLAPVEGMVEIAICQSAPCHIAGAPAVIERLEKELGISMGMATEDGKYVLKYIACQGQCQSSPAVVINGVLHKNVTPDSVMDLLKGGSEL